MENPTYTFRLFGKYEIGINKFLMPIKISLFCWFAGSRTTSAFVSVYLKNQGLTITHLSVMITISVGFQFITGMISGLFADRIGRVKPFLFFYGFTFLVTLVCFTIMPKLPECSPKNVKFLCIDEEIKAQDSCRISQDSFRKDSCSIAYIENATHYDKNENCPFVSLLLQKEFTIENYHMNESSGSCLYPVNFKNYSHKEIPPCKNQDCEAFDMICSDKNLSPNCFNARSFWLLIYGVLVVLYNISRTNVYRFYDVIAMDLSNQYNSDFGKQRLWSILGLFVGPSLAGFISHNTAVNGSDKHYASVFICAAVFAALSFIPVWKVNPKFHKPAATVWKKSFEFIMNLEIILFLILLLTMGISFGFIVIYGNWYLQDLGASDLLIGVSSGISALCGLPFLYTSKWLFNKTGLRNFFVFCLLSYTFYSFSFSLLREPWIAIGIELVNVIAYHLLWVSAIQYCDEVAPVEIQATMKVLAGTLHYNIARLGATAIGGYVMNNFGGRIAYRAIGSLSMGYAIIYGSYLIIHRMYKKKRRPEPNCDEDEKSAFEKE